MPQRMTVAKNKRRAVVPAAPARGKRFLAKLAPVWMEIIARTRRATDPIIYITAAFTRAESRSRPKAISDIDIFIERGTFKY